MGRQEELDNPARSSKSTSTTSASSCQTYPRTRLTAVSRAASTAGEQPEPAVKRLDSHPDPATATLRIVACAPPPKDPNPCSWDQTQSILALQPETATSSRQSVFRTSRTSLGPGSASFSLL